MDKKYEIISLGVNCLPRTILTRGGIKATKAQGELSCPFDLVRHPLNVILHYLETDFNDYFEGLYFTVRKRNFLDFRKRGFWHKIDGTVYNHDRDCGINDQEKLTTRYKNRIKNFRNIVSSPCPVIFVLNIQEQPELIDKLYDVLAKYRKNYKYKLVIYDFNDLIKNNTNENIHILKLPLPIENYHSGIKGWNNKKFRNSPLGKYVEKCICEFTKRVINTLN